MLLKKTSVNKTLSFIPQNTSTLPISRSLIVPNKYDVIPDAQQANWLLVSMHHAEKIQRYVDRFPKEGDEYGCPSTLIWSGTKGNNVPVALYSNKKTGFVFNSHQIIVPQADLIAWNSEGKLSPEFLKHDAEDGLGGRHVSKYPNKAMYRRYPMNPGDTHPLIDTTNLARNEHVVDQKTSIYHPVGSAAVFAKNIWRKFHKSFPHYSDHINPTIMKLNEAIVFQRQSNPIAGLIITDTPVDGETAYELLRILQDNSSFMFYLYDNSSPEHIIRYLDNDDAIQLLQQPFNFKVVFEGAQPYKGFSSLLESPTPALPASIPQAPMSPEPVPPAPMSPAPPLTISRQLAPVSPMSILQPPTLDSIKKAFFKSHEQQKSAQWFQWFRRTGINRHMSMESIIDHARGDHHDYTGNRSYQVLHALGYMNEKKEVIGALRDLLASAADKAGDVHISRNQW